MSLPQRLPLPKLPPKAGLPARPATALPERPTMTAAPAMATPAAPPPSAQTASMVARAPVAAAPRPLPVALIDIHGLSPNMAAMMEAIRVYEDLLVEENAMLRAGDANGVATLLDRKLNATRLYQERQRVVLADSEATRSLSPEQRSQVVGMVRSLEELAKENTILLKANMSAIEQLFQVINSATRKMRKREISYSQAGVIRDYAQAQSSSLAYNHTI
jgi:hypothetical protein